MCPSSRSASPPALPRAKPSKIVNLLRADRPRIVIVTFSTLLPLGRRCAHSKSAELRAQTSPQAQALAVSPSAYRGLLGSLSICASAQRLINFGLPPRNRRASRYQRRTRAGGEEDVESGAGGQEGGKKDRIGIRSSGRPRDEAGVEGVSRRSQRAAIRQEK
jgi:hypothetical protein